MHEDEDDYDEGGGCLCEDDDAGEYEELLNEKLQQARVLVNEEETVESRELLNDVLNHGDDEQVDIATGMIAELDVIIAAAEAAAAESEIASEDGSEGEGGTA